MIRAKTVKLDVACAAAVLVGVFFLCFGGAVGSAASDPSQVLVRRASLVVTMDPSLGEGPLGIVKGGDVLFSPKGIEAVGASLVAPDALVIDAAGKIVMPGFVDVHNHLWQSLIRGCRTDADLTVWLDACVTAFAGDVIGPREAYAAVRLSAWDLIQTGVTTVLDWSHSFNPEFVRADLLALSDSGLRFVYAYYAEPESEPALREIAAELIAGHSRAGLQIASHPTMEAVDSLRWMARVAEELDVPMNVHLLEHPSQRADEPIQALEKAGALSERLIVNHAIHLTDEELALLAARGVRVAHAPLSNMRLASGIMRLPDMLKAGMRVGLGLDGGTNDTSDMFNLMRVAVGLQRAAHGRADIAPTVEQVLKMATIGGAEVLGLEARIGSLTPGKEADLIIIDPRALNFGPGWDPISQIVFNGQPGNVEYVFVGGKALKASGKLVGVSSPEAIVRAAEEALRTIRERLAAPASPAATNDPVTNDPVK